MRQMRPGIGNEPKKSTISTASTFCVIYLFFVEERYEDVEDDKDKIFSSVNTQPVLLRPVNERRKHGNPRSRKADQAHRGTNTGSDSTISGDKIAPVLTVKPKRAVKGTAGSEPTSKPVPPPTSNSNAGTRTFVAKPVTKYPVTKESGKHATKSVVGKGSPKPQATKDPVKPVVVTKPAPKM